MVERRSASTDPEVSGIVGKLNRRMDKIHSQVARNRSQSQTERKETTMEAAFIDARKKTKDASAIIAEAKQILTEATAVGTNAPPPPVHDSVKVQRESKKETKKDEKEVVFQPKGPRALFDATMAQVGFYRNSSKNFEELHTKVEQWVHAPANHIIRRNVKEAKLSFETRKQLWVTLRAEKDQVRKTVETRLAQMEAEFEANRKRQEAKVASENQRIERLIAKRYDAVAREKSEKMAKVAIMCVVIGSRAGTMLHTLLAERPVREKFKRETKAARIIQRLARPVIWRKRGHKIRRGMKRLQALINDYHARWLIKRQQKSVHRILTFTQESSAQSEMKTAISNYMRLVKRVQRAWRRYLTWKDYVMEVREQQFMEVEATCTAEWEKRKEKIDKEMCQPGADPDAIIGDFNVRRPPHKISDAVRQQLLVESFRVDQIGMRSRLDEYAGHLDDYKLKMTTWKSVIEAQQVVFANKSVKQIMKEEPAPDAPRRPIVLPRMPQDEIWVLIKRGHQRMDEILGD